MNDKTRLNIVKKVRGLRLERHWTQARLAHLLDLSQNRLSEIENGQGSFTAEQLISILTSFNVPLDYFVKSKATPERQLQNSLARLGAKHLLEDFEVLPSEKLSNLIDVIREIIVSSKSPRLITGLAPVIVNHPDVAVLNKLRLELYDLGFVHRFGWVLESIHNAIEHELSAGKLSAQLALRFSQGRNIIRNVSQFTYGFIKQGSKSQKTEDIWGIDEDIISRETFEDVQKNSSKVARKWGIVTRISEDEFVEALRNGFNY